jgi:hypothetical protein
MPTKKKNNNPPARRNGQPPRRRVTRRANAPARMPSANGGFRAPTNPQPHQQLLRKAAGMKRVANVTDTCAQVNPFCKAAKGAKYPDGKGQDTATFQVRYHKSLRTDATGRLLAYLSPAVPDNLLIAGAYNTGTSLFTLPSAYEVAPDATFFSDMVLDYRVVTSGVVLRSIGPALTAQGFTMVSKVGTSPGFAQTIAAGVIEGTEMCTMPLQPGSECRVLHTRVGTESTNFVALSSTTTGVEGWDLAKIEVVGGVASTDVIDIEVVTNIEFRFLSAKQKMNQIVAPAAPLNPHAIAAAQQVRAKMPSLIDGPMAALEKTVEKYAGDALDFLSGSLAGLFL